MAWTVFILATAAWTRPKTPHALAGYFAGHWTIAKQMSYVRGGKEASFSGPARCESLDTSQCLNRVSYADECLWYLEDGTITLAQAQQQLAASRKLIYHFHPDRVRVYFDEARTNDPKEVLLSQRFFHDIELPEEEDSSSQPSFSHPCGPDMYRGRLELCDADSFILHWKVEGPRKLGMQTLLYRRCE
jgi:hypothetical protein